MGGRERAESGAVLAAVETIPWFLTFLTNLLRIDYLFRTRRLMKVSSKGHYGLLALAELVDNYKLRRAVQVKEIAKNQQVVIYLPVLLRQ
jgi:hypothetical protein